MTTTRPFLMRYTPIRLRHTLFYRLYARRATSRPELFADAQLAYEARVRLRLVPSDVAHQPMAWAGFYEPQVTRRLVAAARQGGLLIDVGANYGYYTCLWAAARADNRVMAFEASPRNWDGLHHNVTKNDLGLQVCEERVAVGRQRGSTPFIAGPEDQTGWGRMTTGVADVMVDVVDLDSYCIEHGIVEIAVLKIDVEGADAWVVEGSARLLQQHKIGIVFFEEEPARMEELRIAPGTTAMHLRRAGYRVRRIAPGEFMATCA